MAHCTMCGSRVPDGQHVCSMCYGDPYYGNDGYYLAWLEQQAQEEADMEALHLAFYASRYINEDHGALCPACRAQQSFDRYDFTVQDDGTLLASCTCQTCGATWDEVYTIASIRNLNIGDQGG